MRITTAPVRNLFGPLSDEQAMREILSHWTSPHQFQPCCGYHVVFVRSDEILKLDYEALRSVVEYMQHHHPHNDFTVIAQDMIRRIIPMEKPVPKPRPEPEVAAAMYRPMREPEEVSTFEDEPEPRWKVRIRTKMQRGGEIESVQNLEELRDLIDLIEDGPYVGSTKHIKIKLEYLR